MTIANPAAQTKRWREEPEYHRELARQHSAARYQYRRAWFHEAVATQRCAICADRADVFVQREAIDGRRFRPMSCLTNRREVFLEKLATTTPLCYRCNERTKKHREVVPDVRVDVDALPPMPW